MNDQSNDTSRLLVDMAEKLFGEHCGKTLLIAAEKDVWPKALWAEMEDAGLTRALVPEAQGGAGLAIPDALAALRISARHAAPVPFAETLLASWLLSDAGLETPEGALTVAAGTANAPLKLTKIGSGWRLGGKTPRVPFAHQAQAIAVLSEHDGAPMVALVTPRQAEIVKGHNLAREPRDDLTFACDVASDHVAPAAHGVGAAQLRAFGACMRSVQIAGALSRVLDLTLQYAADRVQFGKPIGKFQAIQHAIAMLAGHSAAATAAADMAADAAGANMSPLIIGAAKARCGEAASAGAAIAHQVHGAIGFTHEHMLHFSTKRLWSWRDEFGKEAEWNAMLGRAALSAGSQKLWADVISA